MNDSRRYENLLVAIMFFTWGTVFLDRMSGLYLAPFIAREFQLTEAQIGMLASVLAITWAISTLLFGAISDRVGRKVVLIPAVLAFSLLSWCSGLVHSYHQLLWMRGRRGRALLVRHACDSRAVFASLAPGTQCGRGGQRDRARWFDGCADPEHANRRTIRLEVGLLCCRYSRFAYGSAYLEICPRT